MPSLIKPHEYQTEAFCLKAIDYQDWDKIATFFSPEYGKIQAIVKGARRPKNGLLAVCDIISLHALQLSKRPGLDIVRQGQTIQIYPAIRENLAGTASTLVCMELLNLMVPSESREECLLFFEQLKLTLLTFEALSSSEKLYFTREDNKLYTSHKMLTVLSEFELLILQKSGYFPELERCVLCQHLLENGWPWHYIAVGLGGVICHACGLAGGYAGHSIPRNTVKMADRTRLYLLGHYQQTETLAPTETLLKIQRFVQFYLREIMGKSLPAFDFLENVFK